MHSFNLVSDYQPTGDQPEAIQQLVQGVLQGAPAQVLLGVTGSGKTFTVANVIEQINKPTLILSHNKTLAAQLYTEMRNFFPHNAVEYFVSYYDYYQPEAYIPQTDTYIEKDLAVNEEIDRLRLRATAALLSGRKDVIVVSSVSCLYGLGSPQNFTASMIEIHTGQEIVRDEFLLKLVAAQYSRNEIDWNRGSFRVKGDSVDIYLAYTDYALRVVFWGNEIDEIYTFDPINQSVIEKFSSYRIFPASIFNTNKLTAEQAIEEILQDLEKQVEYFKLSGRPIEAKRIEERVHYDIEMIKELGYCSGIENYSRYFDGRAAGTPPYCLMDYFPEDFLLVIDESHVSVPQIRAMYGGDAARKNNLVEYGFRLPAARDNRPLKFEEFKEHLKQTIYVSATPAEYELQEADGVVVDQLIRPTGLLDPEIDVRPTQYQVDDLMEEIQQRVEADERVLVTTLTKRMAEELDAYLRKNGIRSTYIHSDIDTLERVQIMDDLRRGCYDVLVGVNLLREGLDLPEVSLVAILDADKEGFLRDHRSLTQTAGRAARHPHGKVIMYGDKITQSMQLTIDETDRRRRKQMAYNLEHGITPTAVKKSFNNPLSELSRANKPEEKEWKVTQVYEPEQQVNLTQLTDKQIDKLIAEKKKTMLAAAKALDFLEAAHLRDEMLQLEEIKQRKA